MKILIIEDDIANMEIASIVLESMGYETLTASDGLTGYNMALKHQPNLILTDYHLPGLSGLEIITRARNSNDLKHIPIIIMTADIYAKSQFMNAGCDAYLTKPIRKGTLLRTVNQVLSMSVRG